MAEGFSSKLEAHSERYLSFLLQYSLAEKWITPDEVLEEFPPEALMTALESAAELRSRILVKAAGVHEKIAPKKSTRAASEDLQIALDEQVCSADDVLQIFSADEQVRYLDQKAIWRFLHRDSFYEEASERSKQRVLFAIQTALDEELLDLSSLVQAVTPKKLAEELPREILERALVEAISSGLGGAPFDAETLVLSVPLNEWVEHLPLPYLWTEVIESNVGVSAGYLDAKSEAGSAEAKSQDQEAVEIDPDEEEDVYEASVESGPDVTTEPVSERSQEEVIARTRALENLRNLGREPRHPENLATPLLLAIDGMYAELVTLSDDESRADCIREAFPNEKLLEQALYSLAETLDPRLDEQELRAKNPGIDSLIQLVLYEERRRDSNAPSRSSSPPPALQSSPGESSPFSGSRRSVPPAPLPPPPPKAN